MSNDPHAPIEQRDFPCAEFRFFVFDPMGNGFTYFRSAEDRDRAALGVIDQYLDETWDEEVEQVVAGELSHTCQQVDRQNRPADEDLDEDGCDGEGTYWIEEIAYRCNYALQPLAAATGTGQEASA